MKSAIRLVQVEPPPSNLDPFLAEPIVKDRITNRRIAQAVGTAGVLWALAYTFRHRDVDWCNELIRKCELQELIDDMPEALKEQYLQEISRQTDDHTAQPREASGDGRMKKSIGWLRKCFFDILARR